MIQAVAAQNINRERVVEACEEKDFEVVQDADYDASRLDIVWNINVHTALATIKFGLMFQVQKKRTVAIEWLASHGGVIRLDSISLGLYPEQQQSSVITPSQQRIPEGEKIRKQDEREREEKFDKYNRPQGERMERELKFDENSRPKGQKKVLED